MNASSFQFASVVLCAATLILCSTAHAQTLDDELQRVPAAELAKRARQEGDAARGAVVFFQHHMACAKCHSTGDAKPSSLGPDLATIARETPDAALVESILLPSKVIRKGFESVSAETNDGKQVAGLLVERTADKLVLRELTRGGETTTLPLSEIAEVKPSATSIMPAGQMNQLASRQQFFDLVRYLIEIRDGGAARAKELQPSPALLTFTIPEYESHVDHAGLIGDWNGESLKRGEAIYRRVCANCHGTLQQPGSLPTSLRFAEGKFKNGSDPWAMYQTLTRGFGFMAPQTWMVPSQKYDVIHYIRETYLKPHNPTQLAAVDAAYLTRLPKGDTRGPEPSLIQAYSAMDYGPNLTHTYEAPGRTTNIAYKGIAVRLDPGAGGVARGRHWMLFDTDTLRIAAAWSAKPGAAADDQFIDWHGIQFNGQHGIHPRIVGQVAFGNSTGPGWANPATGGFVDDQRVVGRDGRNYGPLPHAWARFRGLYHHGQQVILSYTVDGVDVLESPRLIAHDAYQRTPLFARTINVGPRPHDLVLQVAEHASPQAALMTLEANRVALREAMGGAPKRDVAAPVAFDGATYVEVDPAKDFDMLTKDFSIAARVKTAADGTIFAHAQPGPKWTPDGQTLFIRGGRLCFDVGWVGAVNGKKKIDDNKWHNVAMTWQHSDGRVRLYVDGKLDAEGTLAAKAGLSQGVVRLGYTAPNFPSKPFFVGSLEEVRFYQECLSDGLDKFEAPTADAKTLRARWLPGKAQGKQVLDTTAHAHVGAVVRGKESPASSTAALFAGFAPRSAPLAWSAEEGRLRLKIPAGKEPLKFTLWTAADSPPEEQAKVQKSGRGPFDPPLVDAERDLAALTHGGPPRWPQKLESRAVMGTNEGAFAVDVLTAPESNPWLAQTRFTGLDFFPDGRLAVCSWDGDVWIVEQSPAISPAAEQAPAVTLRWQRVATGLFQPLGLKIVDGKIHVTCRDQLAVLHDLNGDGETDFYQCLNSDHQVTEHFHEFAMGLQTDAEGNFLYAKSARHALTALVPHHGTLLRVAKDGSRTEIIAQGFRAANGVCLNPDGSFVVTDQEGHWNPKNRINWVTLKPNGKPNFYGNMFAYHDVTDSSDSAMVPPLCWITNAFDRSPAELLWVDSERWGPLNGSLLNLSYGYGKAFLVPHEKVNGQMQGGMIELPLPIFPTGIMRGRFHPADGQLYVCGMFSWAGSATYPGGLYRIRATGQPIYLPKELHAAKGKLQLNFTEPLDPAALPADAVQVKTWALKRTANYGSKHYDEAPLAVRGASLSADGKTLTLDVPDVAPCWCMEIKYTLRTKAGQPVAGTIHNTIHALP